MKRILALFLALAAVLTLSSCASSLEEGAQTEAGRTEASESREALTDAGIHDPTGFAVGFGRVKVTPPAGIGLGGFGNTNSRLSKTVLDDLFVTCVAVSDGSQKALFYAVDFLGVSTQNFDQVAKLVDKELSIPAQNIYINATHTHSAPQVRDGSESVTRYMPVFYRGMTQAAKDAVADLDRAELFIGSAKTENLNYVRRYFREDGTFHGSNYLYDGSSPVVRHESEVDSEMQVIRFARANQKDVVLVNWQCHATTTSGLEKTDVSSDFVGPFRAAAEEENDVYFAYFQGAAGNVVPSSAIESEPSNRDHRAHGKALAQVLGNALGNMEKRQTASIRVAEKTVSLPINCDTEGRDVSLAQKIVSTWETGNVDSANRMCLEYGFHSYYHAKAIVNRSRQTPGATGDMWCGAISFGDVAFVCAPYEMFDTSGMQIKAQSPFAMTFISAYTNGGHGYIPTREAFAVGGYETDACTYAAGSAERMVDEYLGLLSIVK